MQIINENNTLKVEIEHLILFILYVASVSAGTRMAVVCGLELYLKRLRLSWNIGICTFMT